MSVTKITGNLELTPPDGCTASVLLKLVDHTTKPPENVFAVWLLAGRWEAVAVSIPYQHTGETTLRIDVPAGTDPTTAYLQARLDEWWAANTTEAGGTPAGGMLPTDPPVIKH